MAEIDFQMALLLQHRFEQEYKTRRDAEVCDEELARQLQEQFEQEQALEQPKDGLVYKAPKNANSSKSLVDPSWELVDPTPDIHALFMIFNERFFWNNLLAVCVSWSKRMTTCAGICSYNGSMCSITLSEPLLKLRPRKDLVETLLHEMIHAYLFVTHNNKDRDGHGPEFHKHMYRINKESGTNITVYHDFHDEVRLYQQHWWRCNGPCQHRKPYFGMVRRAQNRAPGPNDRWWAEHSRNCGGTFIKVKEPEKPDKKGRKDETKNGNVVKSNDIRKFFTPSDKGSDSNNVKGFKDLNNQVKGKLNSSSTIVVTKNSKTSGGNAFKPTIFNADDNTTKKIDGASGTNNVQCSDDFLAVRNHWANKFSTTSIKRPASEMPSTSTKVPKTDSKDSCECPVCYKKVFLENLNSHLDSCLLESSKPEEKSAGGDQEEKKECPVCNTQIVSSVFDIHVEKCIMNLYNGVEENLNNSVEKVSCLACGKKINKADLNSHLEECMIDIFDDKGADQNEDVCNKKYNCPFCLMLIEEEDMKIHIDDCLKKDIDFVEAFTDDF